MRYFKVFGLVALAAAAVTAFAGSGTASATELTCSSGTMCSAATALHAESEGTVTFHPPIGDVNCTGSTFAGTTSNTGGPTETVSANLTTLTLTGCNATVHVFTAGTLEIHTRNMNADNNGTVTSNNFTFTIEFAGFHCLYKTVNTDIGTLTGSATTSATATLDIEAIVPREGGRSGAFCGSTAPWTGSYKFTSPDYLNVD